MTAPDERDPADKIDRLLDAIELVKADRRDEAVPLLRSLIHEDGNFADAWLWMSVAVESIDQSIICLDNVLRINPQDVNAAAALYRLRHAEIALERRREQLVAIRNWALFGMWFLIIGVMIAILVSSSMDVAPVPVP